MINQRIFILDFFKVECSLDAIQVLSTFFLPLNSRLYVKNLKWDFYNI